MAAVLEPEKGFVRQQSNASSATTSHGCLHKLHGNYTLEATVSQGCVNRPREPLIGIDRACEGRTLLTGVIAGLLSR